MAAAAEVEDYEDWELAGAAFQAAWPLCLPLVEQLAAAQPADCWGVVDRASQLPAAPLLAACLGVAARACSPDFVRCQPDSDRHPACRCAALVPALLAGVGGGGAGPAERRRRERLLCHLADALQGLRPTRSSPDRSPGVGGWLVEGRQACQPPRTASPAAIQIHHTCLSLLRRLPCGCPAPPRASPRLGLTCISSPALDHARPAAAAAAWLAGRRRSTLSTGGPCLQAIHRYADEPAGADSLSYPRALGCILRGLQKQLLAVLRYGDMHRGRLPEAVSVAPAGNPPCLPPARHLPPAVDNPAPGYASPLEPAAPPAGLLLAARPAGVC